VPNERGALNLEPNYQRFGEIWGDQDDSTAVRKAPGRTIRMVDLINERESRGGGKRRSVLSSNGFFCTGMMTIIWARKITWSGAPGGIEKGRGR